MGSNTREIITLQFGHYANFVGSHWWNIQNSAFVYNPAALTTSPKEINNDVLFREGQNLLGHVTYTPRAIIFDLKGSLNTLKQDGVLYDIKKPKEDVNWPGDVTLHKFSDCKKNEFLQDLENEEAMYLGEEIVDDSIHEEKEQDVTERTREPGPALPKSYNLEQTVDVWSDYLNPHLHPRTINLVNDYQHGNEIEKFDLFGFGMEVHKKQRDEIEDKLHFFSEECDRLQGFHILSDMHDGFGGLASAVFEDIADDFNTKGTFVFNTIPPIPNAKLHENQFRCVNMMLSYHHLCNASALVPLSTSALLWDASNCNKDLPHLQYQANLPYHTSAILAASLDNMTLPYRLLSCSSHMRQMTASLTPLGRKVLSLRSSFPFPLKESSLVDSLFGSDSVPLFASLTPSCSNVAPSMQSAVCRGVVPDKVFGPMTPSTSSIQSQCSNAEEVLQAFLEKSLKTSMNAICSVQSPCKVVTPFPQIFGPSINRNGSISMYQRPLGTKVDSVPVMTLLQASNAIVGHLKELHSSVAKINFHKLHAFLDAGLEEEQFRDILDGLQNLINCYETDQMDVM